ncbi:hypothetical protein G6F56_009935 [Rhizopus delemar]|nr:hypothetical protein G6F56_009935 [Rhizopus delemar]
MNRCAIEVLKDIKDIVLAYGQSDEYSFVLPKSTNLYSRRASKISSTIVSLFASNFVMHWATYFEDKLQYAPCFDSRTVCYPNDSVLRDYLSWRQADCHINNLYNTTFWTLVKSGLTEKEAEAKLRGSTIIRQKTQVTSTSPRTGEQVTRTKLIPTAIHDDIIGQEFWDQHPELLK